MNKYPVRWELRKVTKRVSFRINRWRVIKWKGRKKCIAYGSREWKDAFCVLLSLAYKKEIRIDSVGFVNH